jgi:hypothetical protein
MVNINSISFYSVENNVHIIIVILIPIKEITS